MLGMLVSIQCLCADFSSVPDPPPPRVYSPLWGLLRKHILLPMRQRVAGRIAARHLCVSLSVLVLVLYGVWLTPREFSWADVPDVLTTSRCLITAAILWAGSYLLLVLFELLIPCQTHGASLKDYIGGEQRMQSAAKDWIYNMLRLIELPSGKSPKERGAIIDKFVDAAKDKQFSPTTKCEEFRNIHLALEAAASGNLKGSRLCIQEVSKVVGHASCKRFLLHVGAFLPTSAVMHLITSICLYIYER